MVNEQQDDLRSDRQTRDWVFVRGTADNRAARRAKAAQHRLAVRAEEKATSQTAISEVWRGGVHGYRAEYQGATAYGKTAQEAARRARAIALRATKGRNWTLAEKRRYAVCVGMDQ